MTEVRVHIDELVLHGFDPHQRHAIANAVQAELARLLAAPFPAPAGGPVAERRLDAGTVSLEPGARPAAAGAHVAAAVHRAVTGLLAPQEAPHG
ncbi:MAG: hypothetical protein IT303_00245 [Dehalococcoidia bacterium]|nr:hypothetical protein [Dehalococcoidia bacterium]